MLDLSRLLPGPYCTLILAELGAEVVKVEDTVGGDYLRHVPPLRAGIGGAFYALNRGKRSIGVDLKQPRGRELLLRLVADFDVVVESFRPGVLDRLGLGYRQLQRARPQLILCSISGYGQDGPLAQRAGHDINYLALAGVLGLSGAADKPPPVPGVQIADLAGGALWAVIRVLAALRGGEGCHLDVSMTEGALALLTPWLGDLAFGGAPLRRGEGLLNGGRACYRAYRAADGRDLAVGALEPKFWAELCDEVGEHGDAGDQWATPERQAELAAALAGHFAGRSRDEWAERFAGRDACVEPTLELDELEGHPQHQRRGVFFSVDDPRRGRPSLPRMPVDTSPRATSPAPLRGEHTDAVLAEAGLDDAEVARLRAEGVVG